MRPRQFEDAEVLRIAFDQFWRKGVRGTSLSDIAKSAGVQRGSLYNAYGSKEALFLKAYERYSDDYIATLRASLKRGSLREKLLRFFDVAIQNFCAGDPPRGCPTTRGLMELSSSDGHGLPPEARVAFARLLDQVQALLQDTFQSAHADGSFRGDPERASRHLLTVARGLVVLERAYGDQDGLTEIAEGAVDLWLEKDCAI